MADRSDLDLTLNPFRATPGDFFLLQAVGQFQPLVLDLEGFLVGLLDKLPKPEYAKKAYAELNKGNYALAHDLLKTAVEQNRRSDVLDLLSAEIFRREGIPSQAAIIIEKKIEERKVCGIDPFVPYMRLQLGIIYKKGHLWEKSLDNFLRVQKECSGGSEYSLRALYYSSRIAVIISR